MYLSKFDYKTPLLLLVCFSLFVPRMFSLEKDWSSDEARWLNRSNTFTQAFSEGDFEACLQSYHPGVTTMWLGGLGIWTRYRNTLGVPGDALLTKNTLALARTGVVLTIVCALVLVIYILYRLYNTLTAFFAAIFLAFDPFYLAQSRRLHTDGLVATFLTLTILALLLYLNKGNKKYVIISGVCFGLSCLSKSTAVAAIPFIILLFVFIGVNISARLFKSIKLITPKNVARSLFIWSACAGLTFLVLWPVFWSLQLEISGVRIPYLLLIVPPLLFTIGWNYRNLNLRSQPDYVGNGKLKEYVGYLLAISGFLGTMAFLLGGAPDFVQGIQRAITTAHEVPHLFWGRIINDPGPLFYPIMVFIKLSPVIIFLVPLGGFLLYDHRHEAKYVEVRSNYLILLVFVILFCICMSISAKKFTRYVLPIFPFLDVLAALSLNLVITIIRETTQFNQHVKRRPFLAAILVLILGAMLAYQVYSVASLHPHYFSYINPLLSPRRIAAKFSLEDGQGLDPAAEYLNQKPDAEELVVCVSPLGQERFAYYFLGSTLICDGVQPVPSHDYAVVYARDSQINWYKRQWSSQNLEKVIKINDIEYVKIYRVGESNNSNPKPHL